MLLNLMYMFFMAVPLFFFISAMIGTLPELVIIFSLITAIPIGGVYCTIVYCITRMLRDDPEYVWYDIKRKFPAYFKQGIIPGVLYTAYLLYQVVVIFNLISPEPQFGLLNFILVVFSLTVISMVAPYVFLQIAYVDLNLFQIVKNSLILSLANLPRSFMGAVLGNLVWLLFWLLIPISFFAVPIMLFFAFSVSWLICLMWVWPRVNKQFEIEETLKNRFDKEMDEKLEERGIDLSDK